MTSNLVPAREEVFAAIARERQHGIDKWGGQTRGVQAWLLIIEEELSEAKKGWVKTEDDSEALRELLQVAACCLACLEQHGVYERGDS